MHVGIEVRPFAIHPFQRLDILAKLCRPKAPKQGTTPECKKQKQRCISRKTQTGSF